MKFSRMSILGSVLAAVLFAGTAIAQGPHGQGGDFFGPMLENMTDVLDLTDVQQAQIKQIHDNARPTLQSLMQQEHQSHQALMQLITSGNFSEAAAKKIIDQESQVHSQLALQHAHLTAQAYQVLTAEQKTKLTQVMARHEQRMQQHLQEQPPAVQP
ncbi:MAG TPA: Spy/CpxP family protein refolding chaperone [Terriglobales bacterium]|nr:Spy/CpxP family protein refolding chaperone [Terriglobales bacterium]HXY16337.1 Spy/CpxP family protein refolding chaperone [Terriglobales bacterium]